MATRRYLDDKQSMAELIECMPERDRVDYLTFKWLSMEPAFPSRVMVIYSIRDGAPSDIEIITFGEIVLGLKDVPTVRIKYNNRGLDQLVSPVPARAQGRDVFLSIPQHFEFRWAGQEVNGELEFRAHYGILIKSRSRDSLEIEGHTYCLTLKRFLEAYPKLADQVRF